MKNEESFVRPDGRAAALVRSRNFKMARSAHCYATKVTTGAHAILILDQAGWHGAKGLKAPRRFAFASKCRLIRNKKRALSAKGSALRLIPGDSGLAGSREGALSASCRAA